MSYSVIIVDDEKLVINSLALGFDWSATDFEIIATFQNSKEALEQIKLLKPDVVFTDIKMPGLSGLEMMSLLNDQLPATKFVFISGHEDFAYAKKALDLGAMGYLLKPLEDEEILEVLEHMKSQFTDAQNHLEAMFYSMVQNNAPETKDLFQKTFLNVYLHSQQYCIAASILDIAAELQGFVHFTKIKYGKDVYFYFMEDSSILESPGFYQRIRHAIHIGQIKNFSYVMKDPEKDLLQEIESLFNSVYSFYFHGLAIPPNYLAQSVSHSAPSSYFKLLEEAYCKDTIVDMIELLKNVSTLYGEEERTILDALRIYNLIMSLLFRRDNVFFDVPFTSPQQLTESFSDFQNMIDYLRNTLSIQSSSFGKLNLNLIKNDTFKQIITYISQNFASPISFQKICQEYSINPSYLSQVFQRELGTTFTHYLTDLRIHYAKHLLEHTNMIIAEISEKVGYDHYFYFSKLFKKYTSLSPTQYREQLKEKQEGGGKPPA